MHWPLRCGRHVAVRRAAKPPKKVLINLFFFLIFGEWSDRGRSRAANRRPSAGCSGLVRTGELGNLSRPWSEGQTLHVERSKGGRRGSYIQHVHWTWLSGWGQREQPVEVGPTHWRADGKTDGWTENFFFFFFLGYFVRLTWKGSLDVSLLLAHFLLVMLWIADNIFSDGGKKSNVFVSPP